MGLTKRLILGLLLAGTVSAGLLACDNDSTPADPPAQEEQAEATEAEAPEADAVEFDVESLPFYATGPIARVNGVEIEASEFNKLVQEQVERLHQALPPQMIAMVRNQTVERIIDTRLIEAVIETHNLEVTDEEADAYFQEFASQFPDESVMEQYLAQMGVTVAEVRESMVKDVALEKHLSTLFDLEVTEEEQREFFESNREELATPDIAHTRHILIRADSNADEQALQTAEARAREIHALVTAEGANFPALAREHSESPTASNGGDLGPMAREQMMPEYAETAFSLQPGQISEPIRSRFGFHIIQLLEREDASEANYAELEERIRLELRHQKRGEAFQKFLADQREEAQIEKFPENIKTTVTEQAASPPPSMPNLTPPGQAPAQGSGQGGMQLQLDPSLNQP